MDFQNIGTRLLKYILEGLAVAIASRLMTSGKISLQEVAMIGMTAALTFFVLDNLAPSISVGARKGAGFGLGYQGVTMTGAPTALTSGFEAFTDVVPANAGNEAVEAAATGAAKAPEVVAEAKAGTGTGAAEGCAFYYTSDGAKASVEAAATGAVEVMKPACYDLNPLVNTGGKQQCQCTMGCKGCGPELQCPVDCTPKTREAAACKTSCCNIESTGCPYKIVPGQYSHQVILPGYNECVKPYNFYQKWK